MPQSVQARGSRGGATPRFQQSIWGPRRRLIAIGDCHGDFDALRVCLQDLARVLELSWNPVTQRAEARWTGGDTFVVVTGDMLDRYRSGCCVDPKTGLGEGEFPDEELNILRLLNQLNLQAIPQGGRVIKLLGNHEMMNIDQDFRCVHPSLRKARRQRFAPGGDMFETLIACGLYGVVQVGDWIFAHGGLVKSLVERFSPRRNTDGPPTGSNNFIVNINKRVARLALVCARRSIQGRTAPDDNPTGSAPTMRKFLKMLRNQHKKVPHHAPEYGDDDAAEEFMLQDLAFRPNDTENCRDSQSVLWNDAASNPERHTPCAQVRAAIRAIGYRVNAETRVVVGHAVQNFPDGGDGNTGYTYLTLDPKRSDDKRLVFEGPGFLRSEARRVTPWLPSINFSCPHTTAVDPNGLPYDGTVWRIDIGMSRSFDFKDTTSTNEIVRRDLFARRPQILEVRYNRRSSKYTNRIIVSRHGLPRNLMRPGCSLTDHSRNEEFTAPLDLGFGAMRRPGSPARGRVVATGAKGSRGDATPRMSSTQNQTNRA